MPTPKAISEISYLMHNKKERLIILAIAATFLLD
jgi:hypothetical protein